MFALPGVCARGSLVQLSLVPHVHRLFSQCWHCGHIPLFFFFSPRRPRSRMRLVFTWTETFFEVSSPGPLTAWPVSASACLTARRAVEQTVV